MTLQEFQRIIYGENAGLSQFRKKILKILHFILLYFTI